MAILALDLGTKCGWCVLDNDRQLYSGVVKMATDCSVGKRFAVFEKFLLQLLHQYNLTKILYEKVMRHIGTQAAHIYGGFWAILFKIAYEYNIPIVGLGVTTIKKTVTGSGKATKQMMIKAIREKQQREVTDDNEADAIGVLLTGITYPQTKKSDKIKKNKRI